MKLNANFSQSTLLIILTALFFALMILNNTVLRGVRVDLTANNLYTLSDGTRNILKQIQEPINLYLFFSEKETQALPKLRNYYTRVKEVLEEYQFIAGDKLKLHYVDPEVFSEEEDRATQLGLQTASVKGGNKIYFGIAGTNALDTTEVIPFLQAKREAFLEYDLGKLIYNLTHVKKPVLGVMTDLPMYPIKINPGTGRMNDPWVITKELEQVFDVQLVFTDADTIGDEIDVLMVIHPKKLPEKTLYAIDQFVMRGGKGMFFVDPYSEADKIPQIEGMPMQDIKARSSSLNRLFRPWGFSVDENTIIGDTARALSVTIQAGKPAISHPAVLNTRAQDFNHEDVVMDSLESINFYLASHIEVEKASSIEMTALVQTSKQAMPIDIQRFRYIWHPSVLLQDFSPTGERYPLAGRIQGIFKSAFDARPEKEIDADSENEAEDEDTLEKMQDDNQYLAPHIAKTEQPGVMIVIADSDVLTDQMWVQKRQFLGHPFLQPFSGNRDFIVNLIDNLFGSNDLIGIRSRASYSYPFTRVQEIEQKASHKYRATEENLQKELNETESKLQKLQQKRADKKSQLLTASQRKEVNKFKRKKVEIRKKLRNVQHQLVKDIENLGAKIKIINVITMPIIITVIALFIGFLRVRKRKKSLAVA